MAKKRTRILLWIFLGTSFLAIGGACFFLYHHSPFESTLSICPMYRFFHLYCPGCGLTRAFYLLLHGHPLLALRQNPVALPLLLFVLYLLLAEIFSYLFPRPILPRPELPLPLIFIMLGVLVLFAVLRNIPSFSFLAPMESINGIA